MPEWILGSTFSWGCKQPGSNYSHVVGRPRRFTSTKGMLRGAIAALGPFCLFCSGLNSACICTCKQRLTVRFSHLQIFTWRCKSLILGEWLKLASFPGPRRGGLGTRLGWNPSINWVIVTFQKRYCTCCNTNFQSLARSKS